MSRFGTQRNYPLPTVLAIGLLLGALLIFGSWSSTPTLNATAKDAGFGSVETLPERDLRVRSRVHAWAGDCPVEITLDKGNADKVYTVWFRNSDSELTPMYSKRDQFPQAYDMGQELLYGKAGKARGVTNVTAQNVLPPYLCDPRKPHDG